LVFFHAPLHFASVLFFALRRCGLDAESSVLCYCRTREPHLSFNETQVYIYIHLLDTSYTSCSLGQTVLLGLSQKFGITLKEDRDVFGWVGQGVVSLSRGKNDQEASAGMIVLLKPRTSHLVNFLFSYCTKPLI